MRDWVCCKLPPPPPSPVNGGGSRTSSRPAIRSDEIDPMKTEQTMVTMRDGVRISVCVYRPDDAARVPALFAASPYQYEFDTVPAYPLFLWRETGPVEWYVEQGYAYVHADVRGSGGSEGEFGFMDAAEQQDYVQLIAWITARAGATARSAASASPTTRWRSG